MSDEAKKIAHQIVMDVRAKHVIYMTPEERNTIAEHVALALRQARIEALEEACRAVCIRCEWNHATFVADSGEYAHGTDEVPGNPPHRAAVYAYPEPCEANAIRRLIERERGTG